jgi:hypothetical protein
MLFPPVDKWADNNNPVRNLQACQAGTLSAIDNLTAPTTPAPPVAAAVQPRPPPIAIESSSDSDAVVDKPAATVGVGGSGRASRNAGRVGQFVTVEILRMQESTVLGLKRRQEPHLEAAGQGGHGPDEPSTKRTKKGEGVSRSDPKYATSDTDEPAESLPPKSRPYKTRSAAKPLTNKLNVPSPAVSAMSTTPARAPRRVAAGRKVAVGNTTPQTAIFRSVAPAAKSSAPRAPMSSSWPERKVSGYVPGVKVRAPEGPMTPEAQRISITGIASTSRSSSHFVSSVERSLLRTVGHSSPLASLGVGSSAEKPLVLSDCDSETDGDDKEVQDGKRRSK